MQNKIFSKTQYFFIILSLAIPLVYPEIDLFVSSLFYTDADGFYLNNNTIIQGLYQSIDLLVYPLAAMIIGGYFYQLFFQKEFRYFNRRALLYILSVFVIGSGLIVNAGLKEHIGRARPKQIEVFGGDKKFTRACAVTNQTLHNGSFSCGHCSFAFGFLALYFLYPYRWVLVLSVGYGVLVSMARIAQGGHFLSDALYSAIIMLLVSKSIYLYAEIIRDNRSKSLE